MRDYLKSTLKSTLDKVGEWNKRSIGGQISESVFWNNFGQLHKELERCIWEGDFSEFTDNDQLVPMLISFGATGLGFSALSTGEQLMVRGSYASSSKNLNKTLYRYGLDDNQRKELLGHLEGLPVDYAGAFAKRTTQELAGDRSEAEQKQLYSTLVDYMNNFVQMQVVSAKYNKRGREANRQLVAEQKEQLAKRSNAIDEALKPNIKEELYDDDSPVQNNDSYAASALVDKRLALEKMKELGVPMDENIAELSLEEQRNLLLLDGDKFNAKQWRAIMEFLHASNNEKEINRMSELGYRSGYDKDMQDLEHTIDSERGTLTSGTFDGKDVTITGAAVSKHENGELGIDTSKSGAIYYWDGESRQEDGSPKFNIVPENELGKLHITESVSAEEARAASQAVFDTGYEERQQKRSQLADVFYEHEQQKRAQEQQQKEEEQQQKEEQQRQAMETLDVGSVAKTEDGIRAEITGKNEDGTYNVRVTDRDGSVDLTYNAEQIAGLADNGFVWQQKGDGENPATAEEVTESDKQSETEFIESLPKVENGKNSGQIDFEKMSPEDIIRYAEIQSKETGIDDLAQETARAESDKLGKEISDLVKQQYKLNSLTGVEKLAAIEEIKSIDRQIAEIRERKSVYDNYIERERTEGSGKVESQGDFRTGKGGESTISSEGEGHNTLQGNTERGVGVSGNEDTQRFEQKKAEIEQRRQEKLRTTGLKPSAADKINAKYDAALAALDQEHKQTQASEADVRQEEIKPIGKGVFGDIYDQFKGKAKEAINFLLKKKSGEALGALYHKGIGSIDLVWGEEGTGHSDGYGLAKIALFHPEVLGRLQEVLSDMQITQRSENRIHLESDKYHAVVRLDWERETKNWLLTAYEKKNAVSASRTDNETELEKSKGIDTTTSQNDISNAGTKNVPERPKLEDFKGDFVSYAKALSDYEKRQKELSPQGIEQGNDNFEDYSKKEGLYFGFDLDNRRQVDKGDADFVIYDVSDGEGKIAFIGKPTNSDVLREVSVFENSPSQAGTTYDGSEGIVTTHYGTVRMEDGKWVVVEPMRVGFINPSQGIRSKADLYNYLRGKKEEGVSYNPKLQETHKDITTAEVQTDTEPITIKFYDGTIVTGKPVLREQGRVTVESNGRKYTVPESRIIPDGEIRLQAVTDLEAANSQFNKELQQHIDGTLDKGHVYKMGNAGELLQRAGIENLPIEMVASRLNDKSQQAEHPFDLSEVKDLPKAIQSPLAVFDSATKYGSFVILTEIEHNGKNFVVAVEANRKAGKIEVNSIRSIHYRSSNAHIANWINDGLTRYADKQKMSEWFSKQRYNSADVKGRFTRAAKVIQDFDNPKIKSQISENKFKEISKEGHNALVERLFAKGTGKEVIVDEDKMRAALEDVLGKDGVDTYRAIVDYGKADKVSQFIKDVLDGKIKDGIESIEIPESINAQAEKVLGHPITNHRIRADEIRHIENRHGENGEETKNNPNAIPLQNEDIALLPYIMAAPDRIEKGNPKGGKESIKYIKDLSNGYVVVVEREVSPSNTYMENITMWAEKNSHSTNVASENRRGTSAGTSETSISQNDVAKIRKDFDNASNFNNKDNIRLMSTSKGDVYGFVTDDGKVYLDPNKLNANTPIHEFGHLWWSSGMSEEMKRQITALLKETAGWDALSKEPAYANLKSDEQKADELFNRILGDYGENSRKVMEICGNKISLYARVVDALHNFLQWLQARFGSDPNVKLNDFARQTLGEMLDGKKWEGEKAGENNLENTEKNRIFAEKKLNNNDNRRNQTGEFTENQTGTPGLDNGGGVGGSTLRELVGSTEKGGRVEQTINSAIDSGRSGTTTQGISQGWNKSRFLAGLEVSALKNNTWIDNIDDVVNRGKKLKGGFESEVYISKDGKDVIKLNNLNFLNDDDTQYEHTRDFDYFIDRLQSHNKLFPQDKYQIIGFAENSLGEVSAVLSQPFVANAELATMEHIDNWMADNGFVKGTLSNGLEGYTNGKYELSDVKPQNVLVDKNGDLRFIDLDISSADYLNMDTKNSSDADAAAVRFSIVDDTPVSAEHLQHEADKEVEPEMKEAGERIEKILKQKKPLLVPERDKSFTDLVQEQVDYKHKEQAAF